MSVGTVLSIVLYIMTGFDGRQFFFFYCILRGVINCPEDSLLSTFQFTPRGKMTGFTWEVINDKIL